MTPFSLFHTFNTLTATFYTEIQELLKSVELLAATNLIKGVIKHINLEPFCCLMFNDKRLSYSGECQVFILSKQEHTAPEQIR